MTLILLSHGHKIRVTEDVATVVEKFEQAMADDGVVIDVNGVKPSGEPRPYHPAVDHIIAILDDDGREPFPHR